MGRTAVCLAVGVGAVLGAADVRASLYHPDTDRPDNTGVVPVDARGNPEPFPFEEFQRRRLVLRNVINPDWPLVKIDPTTKRPVVNPKTGRPELSDRGVVDARIKAVRAKPPETRTAEERVALAVDLLRFGRPDDAEGALTGLRSGFLPNVTLAHVAATQGQWDRAEDFLDISTSEAERKPPPIRGVSAANLAWQLKLDRTEFLTLARLRAKEARGPKPPPDNELPDRIWPVTFANAAGEYEPGALAAAEKAKLPGGDFPEAIAAAQQLVLWFPTDVRLYWLLGELYAARGDARKDDLRTALAIMNECADSGRYSNRKALMQHREVLSKAASAALPPEDGAPPPPVPFDMSKVLIYFGVVGVLALIAGVRALLKRVRSGAG